MSERWSGTDTRAHKSAASRCMRGRDFLASGQALVLILAVLPFVVLALVSLFKPIFNARGLILVIPYLLLVLAAGIVRLARYPILAAVVVLAVGIAHYSGLRAYNHVSAGRADYKAFAAVLLPQVQSTDLVFLLLNSFPLHCSITRPPPGTRLSAVGMTWPAATIHTRGYGRYSFITTSQGCPIRWPRPCRIITSRDGSGARRNGQSLRPEQLLEAAMMPTEAQQPTRSQPKRRAIPAPDSWRVGWWRSPCSCLSRSL